VAWHAGSPDMKPLCFFLWGCMKLRVNNGGKPKRHHLLEAINETTVGIRKTGMLAVATFIGMTGSMQAV